jgi:thiol:disulfide interchange protein DsbA
MSLLAACGQSEPAADATAAAGSRPAQPAAGASAPAATPAATANAPAADSHAGHAPAAAGEPAPVATAATESAPAAAPATVAAQPARQTAPGIMTDPVAAAGFVEGRHFTRFSAATPPNPAPGQVEVNEFFMYSCPHCNDLEPFVQAWLGDKPDYINFVRVPTTWNDMVTLHAQAYYTAVALGKIEEMHLAFYQSMHREGNYLDTPAKMRTFFERFGVSAEDYDSTFASFSVTRQMSRAEELALRYRVDSTPTFVIAGKYRTGVSEAGGTPDRLFELIEALAAAELQQR